MRPSIDHGILSPSGTVSKAARKEALAREHVRLFPPSYWDTPTPTDAEARQAEIVALRRVAANLRDLATRGMSRTKYTNAASIMEREADALAQYNGAP